MNEQTPKAQAAARRAALSSALRLEIVGLFGGEKELSVSDMAARIGRPATSLYHHLTILEEAEILHEAGTRPKGKRFESVYRLVNSVLELELDNEDQTARDQLVKTVGSAFRMAERDFAAALERDDLCIEGPKRNFLSMRLHMRVGPELLQLLNEHVEAIQKLCVEHSGAPAEPGPDDQFLSVTLALLPLRGRNVKPDDILSHGDES